MTTATKNLMTRDEHKNIYQTIAETIVRSDTQLASEEVRRGAAKLDKINPGWFQKINLRTFNITSSENCVIGQVYGDYDDENLQRVFRLRNTQYGDDRYTKLATQHGFYSDCDGEGTTYDVLQREWEKAIKNRQDAYTDRVPA